jgi:hypothetical protein
MNKQKEKTTRTAKAAENPSTSPAHHPAAARALTVERAAELTKIIVGDEDDERAKALIELAAGIAYAPELQERDGLAIHVTRAAFTRSSAYGSAETTFCQNI